LDNLKLDDFNGPLRNKAIKLIQRAHERGQKFAEEEGADHLILVNLMRKIGDFGSALKIINEQRGALENKIF
jgi:hypothetical protein